jgi:hypothetical protein
MDIAAVRAELAAGLTAGLIQQGYSEGDWQAFGFVPESTTTLPAFVVGVPSEATYARTFASGTGVLTVPITAVVSLLPDWEQAQNLLDSALSTETAGSFYDGLRWFCAQAPGPRSFNAVRYVSAGNYRQYEVGEAKCLAGDVSLEISV